MDRLTSRQIQGLRMRCLGATAKQISARLFIAPTTVNDHLSSAYRAIGIGLLNDTTSTPAAKSAFACYLLGMADSAMVLDPGSEALRPDQV